MNLEDMEIEFKYSAEITVRDYIKYFNRRNILIISGMDHFYFNKNDPKSFLRHRVGTGTNQLTFKRKLINKNNYTRIEHNINLEKNISKDIIYKLCEQLGFKYNMSLCKISYIKKLKDHTIAFYVCSQYDDRSPNWTGFIEIELSEGKKWKNKKEALNKLRKLEKRYKVLGIGPKKRIKESLWELFRKYSYYNPKKGEIDGI